MSAAPRCPECGASLAGGASCRDRYDAGQLKELGNPAYWAVHHLSVPCWHLQHDHYSREGWLWTYGLLVRFLHEGAVPLEIRRATQSDVASDRRDWNVTRGPRLPGVEGIQWSMTLSDVGLESAEGYYSDVHRWAASILVDAATVVTAARGALQLEPGAPKPPHRKGSA